MTTPESETEPSLDISTLLSQAKKAAEQYISSSRLKPQLQKLFIEAAQFYSAQTGNPPDQTTLFRLKAEVCCQLSMDDAELTLSSKPSRKLTGMDIAQKVIGNR